MMKFETSAHGTLKRSRGKQERSSPARALFMAISITLAGALLCSANRGYTQARPSPATQVASVDFLPLAYSYPLTFQYEYKADPVTSWMFRLHYWPSPSRTVRGRALASELPIDSLLPIAARSRAYPLPQRQDLFFFHQTLFGSSQRTAICFDIGGDIAYKWIFDQFAVEPLLGLRIGFGPNLSPSRAIGTEPLIGLSGGYAW